MEIPDGKSSTVFSYRRYHADLKRIQEQDAEIHRLKQESVDQKRRIDELIEQMQRSSELGDEKQKSLVDQLRRELQDQDAEMIEAERTIEMLMRDVQVAREVAKRAEKAQREAEADQMLRHVLRDSDDEGTQSITEEQLRSELKRMTNAGEQSARRASALEQELTVLRDTAEMLSVELQAFKTKTREVEIHAQEAVKELEVPKIKTDEEIERWKAVANLRQELVATLQTQVKGLRSDKDTLENAIFLCQRSADKRLQLLECDRQNLEAENVQLLIELTSIRQELKAINLKFREFEKEGVSETTALEEETERRPVQPQTHQQQLDSRFLKAEQISESATLTAESADRSQWKESQELLMTEKNKLLQQLEEERRQSKELKCSAVILKKATESALKELKDVEIELRELNGKSSNSDGQHESLVSLAKQVVEELKRQDGASMEAVVASIQVQYLTSLMHGHLSRLCALREQQKARFTSPSSSDSDSSSESAATSRSCC